MVANALQWVVRQQGVEWIYHYLVDFVCLGALKLEECHRALAVLLSVCSELQIHVATC